jgi:DHA1 family tetracycline resistance protein-like MFS transporter
MLYSCFYSAQDRRPRPSESPLAAMAEQGGATSEMSQQRKRYIARIVCAGELCCAVGNTPLISTRAPLILKYFVGYSALEASRLQAKTMGNMSSLAAAVECTVGPILGRLSDTVGRKNMLLISPLVQAGCHASVAAFPGVRWIMFLDRVFSGAGLYMHIMLSNAVLSDLFEGQELAQIRVVKQSMFSAALIIGPLLGNLLGNRIGKPQMAFALTPIAGVAALAILTQLPETLPKHLRRAMDWAACNPLRFLKLFKNRTMTLLTLARGLQDAPEFISIYDINFVFLNSAVGWAPSQVGIFTSCYGATQLLSGRLAAYTLPALGGRKFTTVSHASMIVAWILLGRARSLAGVALALAVSLPCHRRMEVVHAFLVKHACKEESEGGCGMGKGEAESCVANWVALLKVVWPFLYSRIFAVGAQMETPLLGLPYFFMAGLIAGVQGLLMLLPKDELE